MSPSRRPWCTVAVSLALAGLFACEPKPAAPTVAPSEPAAPPAAATVDLEQVRRTVSFLAADAQEGRAPGGGADARVQEFLIEEMRTLGLEPAGGDGYRQRFGFTDGVRLREGEQSRLFDRRLEIPHHLLPFGHDTGAAAVAGKLIFVGHGVAGEAPSSGDYAGLADRVAGKIVVALEGGDDDPHASAPANLRPQSKLIAARDRGAIGFVLWDPDRADPWPNEGMVRDLEIPAVFVGSEGNAGLREWLSAPADGPPKRGATTGRKVELRTPIVPVELETANLIGRLPGGGDPATRSIVVVGAHMDHLGLGGSSSLAPGERAIHNGADDNASGVAAMLAIARALAAVPAQERANDLLFVAFGAEERGLLGSKHLVDTLPPEQRARILAMLNFDMVGRLGDKLIVDGTGTATEWPALLEAKRGSLVLAGHEDGWGPSDHSSFYGANIPVLHFFTGAHDDYHRPGDDVEKIDWEGIGEVVGFATRLLTELTNRRAPLGYVAVKQPDRGSGGFRVSLGTIPDYAATVDGLALAGVRAGGPAESAGLAKGDVIVKIGTREVHNIDDYMASFAEMKAGEAIAFEILRGGERLTVSVTPAAARSDR